MINHVQLMRTAPFFCPFAAACSVRVRASVRLLGGDPPISEIVNPLAEGHHLMERRPMRSHLTPQHLGCNRLGLSAGVLADMVHHCLRNVQDDLLTGEATAPAVITAVISEVLGTYGPYAVVPAPTIVTHGPHAVVSAPTIVHHGHRQHATQGMRQTQKSRKQTLAPRILMVLRRKQYRNRELPSVYFLARDCRV